MTRRTYRVEFDKPGELTVLRQGDSPPASGWAVRTEQRGAVFRDGEQVGWWINWKLDNRRGEPTFVEYQREPNRERPGSGA